ncbi:MAG: glycosyltransferase family 2 protein [Lachnospiraceae bacterium]|jgi:glycosyltransferase involved in cell wall biosynthesis
MSTVVLIPAYNPDRKLITLVEELKSRYFDIVIVNDGSSQESAPVFEECGNSAVVTGYDENVGKGNALKHGMEYIQENFPGASAFITADADGQHSVEDICRIRDALIDGEDFVVSVRNLRKGVPILSRIGNSLSRFMFAVANARFLPDNQSGLRGFSTAHIDWMLKVRGLRYDYELNIILIAEKQGIRISNLPIETIYFDNNSASHFRPFQDTIRIYMTYFRTNIFVVISIIIEMLLVVLAMILMRLNGVILRPSIAMLTIMVNWVIHTVCCQVIERYIMFRWIKYTPGTRRLVISIFKYFICMMFCWGCLAVKVPFILAYVVGMILINVGEYYILKVTYD